MKKKLFLFLFLIVLVAPAVFSQQNHLSFNESFKMVFPYEWNHSLLPNTTRITDSTGFYSISEDTGFRWYIGNLRRSSRISLDGVNYYASLGYYHYDNPYGQDGIAGFGYGQGQTDTSFIFKVFPDEITITEDTHIETFGNGTRFMLVFLDSGNNCKLGIIADGDWDNTSFFSPDYMPYSYCLGQTGYKTCGMQVNTDPGSLPIRNNITMGICLTESVKGIKKLAIMPQNGLTENAFLDEIVMLDYLNGSNQMPSINLTFNQSQYCMQTNITIPFTINESDPEGDDILYKLGSSRIYYNWTEDLVTYDSIITPLFNQPDYDFFKQDNHLSGVGICDLPVSNTYNSSRHNFMPFTHENFGITPIYGLELNSNCTAYEADQEFYYKLSSPKVGFSYETQLYKIDNGDKANITFYDLALNPLFTVRIIAVSGKIQLWHGIDNLANVTNDGHILVNLYGSLDKYNVTLWSGTRTNSNITHQPFLDVVSYAGLAVEGSVIQSYFQFFSSDYGLESAFDTNKPDHANFTKAGYQDVIVYYTDSEHLDTYKMATKQILILEGPQCKYIMTGQAGSPEDAMARVDILGAIKGLFGKSLEQYLRSLGVYEAGKTILWFIFIVGLLILLVSSIMVTGQLNLTVPLLVMSIAVGFLALMVGYTTHFLVMLIFIAFALAGPLANSWGARH